MFMKSILLGATASAFVLAAGAANATISTYTTVSSFVAASTGGGAPAGQVADNVNWGVFAQTVSPGQPVDGASIQSPQSMTTVAGETITATNNGNNAFNTYVEGGSGSGSGTFANGTVVLGTSANTPSQLVTLSFATALSGIGFHVEDADAGNYSFTITAFNFLGISLGSVTNSGGGNGLFGSPNTPGTAPFAGLLSTAYDISFVRISETPPFSNGSGFAIDTSLIYHTNINGRSNPDPQQGGTSTPEPGTLGLLGAGLAGLGWVRRRRNKKA